MKITVGQVNFCNNSNYVKAKKQNYEGINFKSSKLLKTEPLKHNGAKIIGVLIGLLTVIGPVNGVSKDNDTIKRIEESKIKYVLPANSNVKYVIVKEGKTLLDIAKEDLHADMDTTVTEKEINERVEELIKLNGLEYNPETKEIKLQAGDTIVLNEKKSVKPIW